VIAAPANGLSEALARSGVELVEVPLPVSPAAKVVLAALPLTGCILRSADEADALDEERQSPAWSPNVVAWCLSRDAASRAMEKGWQNIEQVPTSPDGAELVAAMERRRAR
jgi:hypothetical protein